MRRGVRGPGGPGFRGPGGPLTERRRGCLQPLSDRSQRKARALGEFGKTQRVYAKQTLWKSNEDQCGCGCGGCARSPDESPARRWMTLHCLHVLPTTRPARPHRSLLVRTCITGVCNAAGLRLSLSRPMSSCRILGTWAALRRTRSSPAVCGNRKCGAWLLEHPALFARTDLILSITI